MMRVLQVLFLATGIASAAVMPIQDRDILEYVQANSLGIQIQEPGGRWREAKYGDPWLERAVQAIGARPRPWTVPKVLGWYAAAQDSTTRAHLLRILAASRDPRGAVVLGSALSDTDIAVRIAAIDGLAHYFVRETICCGSEGKVKVVTQWWGEHGERIQREAQQVTRSTAPN